MMALQLYFTLICAAEGGLPMQLIGAITLMILASMFAFFQPSRVNGINALQSNGA